MKTVMVLPETSLTTDWVNSSTHSLAGVGQLILYVDFVRGYAIEGQIQLMFSPDGVKHFCETTQLVSLGDIVMDTAPRRLPDTGSYRIAVPVSDYSFYIKVKAVGATITGTKVSVIATMERGFSSVYN